MARLFSTILISKSSRRSQRCSKSQVSLMCSQSKGVKLSTNFRG